jgi:hypothetical protein
VSPIGLAVATLRLPLNNVEGFMLLFSWNILHETPVRIQETPAIIGYVQNGTQEPKQNSRVWLLRGG